MRRVTAVDKDGNIYSKEDEKIGHNELIYELFEEFLEPLQGKTLEKEYEKKLKSMTMNFDEIFRELENSILYMANCAEGYQAVDQTVIKEICDNLNISQPNLSTSNIFNGV